ncbi:MAG: DUF4249 domain-containing protein [Aquirufa sp.]
MRYLTVYIIGFISFFLLTSCEEIVTLDSPNFDNYFVVQSTLTDQKGPQQIFLSKSQNYFDNTAPVVISGANVEVKDNEGNKYRFTENPSNKGNYVWTPSSESEVFGKVGRTYQLSVKWSGESYSATSKMYRVPPVDSILYQYTDASGRQSGTDKPKKGYDAQFFARDPIGVGDCYRVKFYKNGVLFNGTNNLTLLYDSNFQKGSQADGLLFILPVRRAISPELYLENDKIKVELYSISEDQFNFWSQARLELNNAGLFSRPAANIPTNIVNANPSSKMQGAGWFGVSAVTTLETVVDPKKARTNLK